MYVRLERSVVDDVQPSPTLGKSKQLVKPKLDNNYPYQKKLPSYTVGLLLRTSTHSTLSHRQCGSVAWQQPPQHPSPYVEIVHSPCLLSVLEVS